MWKREHVGTWLITLAGFVLSIASALGALWWSMTKDNTSIAALLSDPERYDGKKVTIEGTVDWDYNIAVSRFGRHSERVDSGSAHSVKGSPRMASPTRLSG